MSKNTKTRTTTLSPAETSKKVTKTIRLTAEQAEELTSLLEGTAYVEATILRQWVITGMQQFRVSEALKAYQEGHISLRQAAEHAKLPVAVLLEEMAAKNVAVLEHLDAFGPGLSALREAFGK